MVFHLIIFADDDMEAGIRMSDCGSSNEKMLIDPAQHLFLWSILLNRFELSKIFLYSSQDNIGTDSGDHSTITSVK